MAQLPFIAAIDAGIHQEMRRDPSVLYFGQNMATTENHEFVAAYGHDRVRVTPISETAEIGIAIGAAMAGLRPVVELYMAEFMLVAMDQVRQRSAALPLHVGRTGESAAGAQGGFRLRLRLGRSAHRVADRAVHGRPGLKVVVPSTAADAKGLMATAIRDDNPVVFLHHYLLTLEHGRGARRRAPGAVRQGRDSAPGRRRDHRRDRLDGAALAGRGREARRGGDPGRSDRPAHGRAARS